MSTTTKRRGVGVPLRLARSDEAVTPDERLGISTSHGPLAPEQCVEMERCVSPDHVWLVGTDLSGAVRVKVELSRDDVSEWWVEEIRYWLAGGYGAAPPLRV